MRSNFLLIKRLLENDEIQFTNEIMKSVVRNYSYYEVSSNYNYKNNQQTYQQMKDSKIVIISQYKENGNDYFIIGFRNTIINIKQDSINFLHSIFSYNTNLKICFLLNSKESFDYNINIQYNEINSDSMFEEEIENFIEQILIRQNNHLFKLVLSCIAGYLIKNSYIKTKKIVYIVF